MNYKKLIYILPLLFIATTTYAGFFDNWNNSPVQIFGAPTQSIRYERNILPETDSLYELGTSTKAWLRINTDILCLTGDTCRTTWPTGTAYTVTYPITLTGSAFGIAFGTTTANTWTALQQFANASSSLFTYTTSWGTNLYVTYASTTLLSANYASSTLWYGGGLQTCNSTTGKLTWTNGVFACGTDYNTGGGGSDFTFDTTYGELSAATSSPLWIQGNLYASSTNSYIDGNLYATLPNYVLYTGATGDVDLGAYNLKATKLYATGASTGGIDLSVSNILDTSDGISIDFNNRYLADTGGDSILMWNIPYSVTLNGVGGGNAIFDTSLLTASDKTFTFPNESGIFLTTATTSPYSIIELLNLTNATTTELTTDKIYISGDEINDFQGEGLAVVSNILIFDCSDAEGTGINCSGEDIVLDATGDWTGTLDGIEGADFVVNADINTIAELNAILTAEDVASTTWAGASSLITLGTITTGVWHGTDIDISDYTTLTAGDGITLTDDDLDCDTANGTTFGCLTAANWNTFNNKWDIASSTLLTAWGGTGSTTLSGILKGAGTGAVATAVSGTDYVVPAVTTLSSLVSIGTITTGVWNGTSILPAYGGTGLGAGGLKTAYIPFGAGTNAFATSSALYFTTATSILTVTNASTTNITNSGWANLATLLGTIDAGGATSFEIVNGNPTFNAIGQIGFDTTDMQFLIATTTANSPAVIPTMIKLSGGGIASTSPDFVSGGRIPTTMQRDGFVVREIHCMVDGGTSVVINFSNLAGTTDSETITCTTAGASDTDITTNPVYSSGGVQSIEIGTITGTVDYMTYSIYGHFIRE